MNTSSTTLLCNAHNHKFKLFARLHHEIRHTDGSEKSRQAIADAVQILTALLAVRESLV